MNITELDVKKHVSFFNKLNITKDNEISSSFVNNTNKKVWNIDNLLSSDECDIIIDKSTESGFEHLQYRNSDRVLLFDSNNNLITMLEERLHTDYTIERINKLNIIPYGFNTQNYKWNKCEGTLNKCLRINKYSTEQGFKWHRDAQFTDQKTIKSVFTLLIYLNDDFDGGETVFRIPKNEYVNNGYTIDEELKIIGNDYVDIQIKPKKGMGLIFDQRLIHSGNLILSGNKYVLRTDIIVDGIEIKEISKKENKIYDLTCSLFRQAQLLEIYNGEQETINKLYEICIGLRQTPNQIKTYPKKLEKFLTNVLPDTNAIFDANLMLIEQNGLQFKYTYNKHYIDKYELLKSTYLYSIMASLTNVLSKNNKPKIDEIKKYIELNIINDLKEINLSNTTIQTKKEIDCSKPDFAREVIANKQKKEFIENFFCDILGEDTQKTIDTIGELEAFVTTCNEYGYTYNDFDEQHTVSILNETYDLYNFSSKHNNTPFDVLLSTKYASYSEVCEGCGLCDSDCYNNESNDCFYNTNVDLIVQPNFKLILTNIKTVNDITYGNLEIHGLSDSFNHASCNCEKIIEFDKIDENNTKYLNVKLCSTFVLTPNNITINIIPKINM